MSSPIKAITYSELAYVLSAPDMQADFNDACQNLALSLLNHMDAFENVAKPLHSVDILGVAPSFKQKWAVLAKSFKDLLWHFRLNAGFLSARLKMFCTVVLPLTARNSSGSDEKLQVLRSFMTITADLAALTRNLVTNAMKFNNALNAFHSDFSDFASRNTTTGQKELRDLSDKLVNLENTIVQLCLANGTITSGNVINYAFSVFRTISTSRRQCSRTRPFHRRLALDTQNLATTGRLYGQLDMTKSEVSHAQYAAQVCHRRADAIITAQTIMSTLVSVEMIAMECGLGLLLSAWSRLQVDCTQLLQWLQCPESQSEVPFTVLSLLDGGHTIYGTVADGLDACVLRMDPVHFATQP